MPDRILASFRRTSLALETQRKIDRATNAAIDQAPVDPGSPAGKRALRGIPVVGACSGTSPGTDPLHALLDQQRRNLADTIRP